MFLLLILGTGVWLGVAGKPFSSALLNVHKLISLAGAVIFGLTVFQIGRKAGLSAAALALAITSGVLFLGAIVSGGLASITTMPAFLTTVHRVTLSLAAVATAVTLYLLRGSL